MIAYVADSEKLPPILDHHNLQLSSSTFAWQESSQLHRQGL